MYSQKIRMEMAVGEQSEAFSILLCDLLIQVGHGTDEYLIDVGYGSGRLTKPHSQYLSGRYLGIDVALEHVAY
ncbi:MAG TPA: class I SAM-dependent methyltransferase, partial [Gammaproteobacteria bacterium]|nr:class I SAM-dependent methyltransferase [Gammaproteobacteria bacterium]